MAEIQPEQKTGFESESGAGAGQVSQLNDAFNLIETDINRALSGALQTSASVWERTDAQRQLVASASMPPSTGAAYSSALYAP